MLKKYWPIALALANAALLTIILRPDFNSTDDAYLMGTVCGLWTGGQSHPAMVASHVWLGELLQFFYNNWPAPNWYVVFQTGLMAVSAAIILPKVVPRHRPFLEKILWAETLFIALLAEFFLWPQYTKAGFLAGLAGWLLWLYPKKWSGLLGGLFLILLGGMLRAPVFSGLFVLFLPVALLDGRLGRFEWGVKLVLPCALFALLMVADSRHYDRYWGAPGLQTYLARLDALANGPKNMALTPPGVLTQNDVRLIESWALIDGDRLGRGPVEQVGSAVRSVRGPGEGLAYFFEKIWDDAHCLLIALLTATALGLFVKEKRRAALLLAGWVGLVFLGLAFTSRLPHHVLWPMVVGWVVVLRVANTSALPGPPKGGGGWRKESTPLWFSPPLGGAGGANSARLTLLCLLAALAISIANLFLKNRLNRRATSVAEAKLAFFAQNPDKLFVTLDGLTGLWSWQNPAHGGPKNLIRLGWLANTPVARASLNFHKIGNLAAAMAERPERFVVETGDVEALQIFFEEHYGCRMAACPADGFDPKKMGEHGTFFYQLGPCK